MPWTEPRLASDYVSEGEVRDRADPPRGPSGISPDPPTLDPIRAHALLCAATFAVGEHITWDEIVRGACIFEHTYLRGD